ncbi:hypothetical protein Efla_002602 [Eimeria flavescens]
MKAVGLVSGGKDSIFAMHCAHELGNSICAVATLLPRDDLLESDSYMYQSVGTRMTAAVAACLGVPHFCAEVRGKPLSTESLDYETTSGDEVEDLHGLLLRVKSAIPEVEAVTCGAILSEFQRRRLEHVCQRLGLVPLCLMWNREQEALLTEMVEWGLHAVLVKTASMGLSRKHLGKDIAELLPHFTALNRKHDFHVCGEGGEYETLTLDCPLFRKACVVVSEWQEVCQNEDPIAPVYLLSPLKWAIRLRDASGGEETVDHQGLLDRLNAIELRRLQPYGQQIREAVSNWSSALDGFSSQKENSDPTAHRVDDPSFFSSSSRQSFQCRIKSAGCMLAVEVSFSSGNASRDEQGCAAPREEDFLAALANSMNAEVLGRWLDMQLGEQLSSAEEGVSRSPVQTICQLRCLRLAPAVEELFSVRSIRQHPITFIATPLPDGVVLRFRMLFGYSHSAGVEPSAYLWKSPVPAAVLHVHSMNWWVPPCSSGGARRLEKLQRTSPCRNCQGVRCEPVSEESGGSPSYVFLRGLDGRYPHNGRLPDPASNWLLATLSGEASGSKATQEALNVTLQAVNAFINVQHTLRCLQPAHARRGFADAAYAREEEASGAGCYNGLEEPPPILLAFVKSSLLEGNSPSASVASAAWSQRSQSLKAVEHLVTSLVAQKGLHARRLESPEESEKHAIVIAAEVTDLPEGAKSMIQPLWSTAGRRGERRGPLHYASSKRLRFDEAGWSGKVTSLSYGRGSQREHQALSAEGDANRRSIFTRISFNTFNCDDTQVSSSSLSVHFYTAIDRTLKNCFVTEDSFIPMSGFGDNQVTQAEGKHMLEILVFYSASFAGSLGSDVDAFETNCSQLILGVFNQRTFATTEPPLVTFVPVKNLADALVEILVCSLS